MNRPIEARLKGFSSANEYSGGMKAHQASAVEMTVAITAPGRPPIQELKNRRKEQKPGEWLNGIPEDRLQDECRQGQQYDEGQAFEPDRVLDFHERPSSRRGGLRSVALTIASLMEARARKTVGNNRARGLRGYPRQHAEPVAPNRGNASILYFPSLLSFY